MKFLIIDNTLKGYSRGITIETSLKELGVDATLLEHNNTGGINREQLSSVDFDLLLIHLGDYNDEIKGELKSLNYANRIYFGGKGWDDDRVPEGELNCLYKYPVDKDEGIDDSHLKEIIDWVGVGAPDDGKPDFFCNVNYVLEAKLVLLHKLLISFVLPDDRIGEMIDSEIIEWVDLKESDPKSKFYTKEWEDFVSDSNKTNIEDDYYNHLRGLRDILLDQYK